jgi:glycosyltransferase involved in cell wall biosynthesis
MMKDVIPKVSIGLPVYNGEKYLRAALDSLLQQDYKDFELIISDNASTDTTSKICKSYADRDKRIQYYRNETNLGATRNFNDVLKLARGQYFKWAAYDDECHPSMLRKCVETLDSAPKSVILTYTRAEIIDSQGHVCGLVSDRANIRLRRPHQRMAKLLFSFHLGVAQYGLFRRDVLQHVRPFGTIATDRVMLTEIAMRGEIWEVPEVLFRLRLHPENALAVYKSRRQIEAWNDPSRKNCRLILPYELAVLRQHWKSVGHLRLGVVEKALCYAVPVVVPVCRRVLRWKGWIASKFHEGFGRGRGKVELKSDWGQAHKID